MVEWLSIYYIDEEYIINDELYNILRARFFEWFTFDEATDVFLRQQLQVHITSATFMMDALILSCV